MKSILVFLALIVFVETAVADKSTWMNAQDSELKASTTQLDKVIHHPKRPNLKDAFFYKEVAKRCKEKNELPTPEEFSSWIDEIEKADGESPRDMIIFFGSQAVLDNLKNDYELKTFLKEFTPALRAREKEAFRKLDQIAAGKR